MRLPSISLVAVVAVGLLTAGCGSSGSKTTSTTDWVNGVCSSVATWQTSIKSSANSLKGGNLSQNSLKTAVGDMKSATDTLQSDLKDLGKPDSDAGQKAKDSIDELTSELKKDTDTMKSAADDVSDLSSAATAATTISTTFASMGTQVKSTFSSLKQLDPKGELKTAFQQSSACQKLSKSS